MLESETEIMLTAQQQYEPDWKVDSADFAVEDFRSAGATVIAGLYDIPIGRLAVVEDPFGNRLVLLDTTKGTYRTERQRDRDRCRLRSAAIGSAKMIWSRGDPELYARLRLR